MKKTFWILAWLFLVGGIALTTVAGAKYFHLLKPSEKRGGSPSDNTLIAASESEDENPGNIQGVSTIVETQDARTELVAEFLKRHNSPLKPYNYYGEYLVSVADKNGFDFRLLPAIAMQESNLCKVIPENSYNCLGFGVHSQGTLTFENFEANFERAARELKSNYIDIGLTTPEQIMTKYTPHSNGSWADSVNQWMAEMRYNDRQLGRELDIDADVLEFVPE